MKEYTFLKDKHLWGDGPWVQEPDRVEWVDEETGYQCLARRTKHTGTWCGYVGVPPGHPWFGKTDREHTKASSNLFMKLMSAALEKYGGFAGIPDGVASPVLEQHPDYDKRIYELECHGGVTFTGHPANYTYKDWEAWRKSMIARLPEIETYPRGDAAEAWADYEQYMNNYQGWIDCQNLEGITTEQPDKWWLFGFDCAHCDDVMPGMDYKLGELIPGREPRHFPGAFYRDLPYVKDQCTSLALQLKAIEQTHCEEQGHTNEGVSELPRET